MNPCASGSKAYDGDLGCRCHLHSYLSDLVSGLFFGKVHSTAIFKTPVKAAKAYVAPYGSFSLFGPCRRGHAQTAGDGAAPGVLVWYGGDQVCGGSGAGLVEGYQARA